MISLLFELMLAAGIPAYGVTFTANTLIDDGDMTYEGQDVIVEGCTVTINGAHSFNSLVVRRNAGNVAGVVTHSAGFAPGMHLTIAGDVQVQGAEGELVTSRFDASGKGYGPSSGPGMGGSGPDYGAGAGYGGQGGNGSGPAIGGQAYGSITSPGEAGSGGGAGGGGAVGGAGGGMIKLTVTGTLTVDRELTADGGEGQEDGGYCGGGGAAGPLV